MKDIGKKIIRDISHGDESVIEWLYTEFIEEFLKWSKKHYNINASTASEIYQIAVLITYENIVNKKLTEFKSDVKTYIFSIARNKLMEKIRDENKYEFNINQELIDMSFKEVEEKQKLEQYYEIIEKNMHLMTHSCRKILESFYYYQKSVHELSEELGYKNSDTLKAAKYKCLQKLKEMCQSDFKKTAKVE